LFSAPAAQAFERAGVPPPSTDAINGIRGLEKRAALMSQAEGEPTAELLDERFAEFKSELGPPCSVSSALVLPVRDLTLWFLLGCWSSWKYRAAL